LQRARIDLAELAPLGPPPFRALSTLTAALAHMDTDTFAALLTPAALQQVHQSLDALTNVVDTNDRAAFAATFDAMRHRFGNELPQYQSDAAAFLAAVAKTPTQERMAWAR
jgi:hypothetical protein